MALLAGLSGFAHSSVAANAYKFEFSQDYRAGDSFMRVRLLGALRLPKTLGVNGHHLSELSGLAWDEDEQLLYALSDQGRVFHLRPIFTAGRLTDVDVVDSYALRDEHDRILRGPATDSEGLGLQNHRNGQPGDTRLIIAFERIARVSAYDPKGIHVHSYELPKSLRNPGHQGHNRGFESVAHHPEHGLLTAPELPIRSAENAAIYALDGASWIYPRYPAPNSALVAMETLPDGSLLTLERSFTSVWLPVRIILRRTAPLTAGSQATALAADEIAVFNSYEGWRIDNFEGLARHQGMRFFLVSDDNESAMQKTILMYLEVLDVAVDSAPVGRDR